MIVNYKEFEKIKLSDFVNDKLEIIDKPEWEWMNCYWYCEKIGFSWVGQPSEMKGKTGGFELDLNALDNLTISSILNKINLPLKKGATEKNIESILGKSYNVEQFVEDRKSINYILGDKDKYYISCTVHNETGLVFLSVMRYDLYKKYNKS